jgi:hypothetical protein
MKLGIDWSQASTKRGLVWVATAIVGAIGWFYGKDVSQIILLGTAVAGGIGVAIKD